MMWVLLTLLMLFGHVNSETSTRFTNIKCDVLDPSYCAYKECQLKVLGRGIIGLNVHVILLKGSVTHGKVNIGLLRKYNGFRPFMFNITVDFCKFMAKGSSEMSYGKFLLELAAGKSNINHSCPYEKEILIRDLVLKENHFKFLPLPTGEYQIQLAAFTKGQWKTKVYANFLRQEDIMES